MAATDPIRKKSDIQRLVKYFLHKSQLRNYVLVVLSIYTALRISDTLALTWNDVYDFARCKMRSHIDIKERKTGKRKRIALNKDVCRALLRLYDHRQATIGLPDPNSYIFVSRNGVNKHICRSQAWRIIKHAADELGIEGHISCHSLRKTPGYCAWQEKEVSPVMIMDVYNHSSYDTTKCYLGVTQDDRDKFYLGLSLLSE